MAQLVITERKLDDSTILDLTGDVVFGESNTVLRQRVRSLISEGRNKISINLRDVGYLDSSGIGELISALTAVSRARDGHLRILNPTERIQTLFDISKLTGIFEIDYEEN